MKLKQIISLAKKNLHYLALLVVLILVIQANRDNKFWKIDGRIIAHDVIIYYQYLPSTFIYGDVSMKFLADDTTGYFHRKIWGKKLDNGNYISKMTMGLSVLYSPFFFTAHTLAEPMGYEANGFSPVYKKALIVSSIVYLALGLYFLLLVLSKRFSRLVVATVLLVIGLGTNLYFYTTIEPTMSHAYSFFLFALFLWAMDKWYAAGKLKHALLTGFAAGLIALVRPNNLIIVLLIPLWGVSSFKLLGERFRMLLGSWRQVGLMFLVFILVITPQLIYWKYVSGSFFFYGYGDEGFFFGDPEFIKGIFSYRKGWLVYTPVMAFSIIGMYFTWKGHRQFFYPVLLFIVLHMYISFSWWCWWYGGGFGQRIMVETYAILALPLAAFFEWLYRRHFAILIPMMLIVGFLVFLNQYQTKQYYWGSIHWDAMSKDAYWYSFLKKKPTDEFYELVEPPDYKAALEGDR